MENKKGYELTLKLINLLEEIGTDERIQEDIREGLKLKLLAIILEG